MDQFVTRLKNKVKSCEYMVRDLIVKERLLKEDKLTLEKAISMARVSEASKEQI